MSRFLDERGRIFGRVNIVDILVLLVIVAVVVFAVVRLTGGGSATYPVRVTFHAEELRKAEADYLKSTWKNGTTLVDPSGTVLGKVESVTLTDTPIELPDAAGIPVDSPSGILRDVVVVILGQGQASITSAHINGVSVFANDKIVLGGASYAKPMIVLKAERVK